MKKRAFTFAELMISLLIISILAAILYPTLAHFRPNNNKPLFKSAYKILTTTISEIVNERIDGELPLCLNEITNTECQNDYSNSRIALCRTFCEKMNMVSVDTCGSQCNNYQITTSNGMRWSFERYYTNKMYQNPMTDNSLNDKVPEVFKIWVDVNSSNNKLDSENHCGNPINTNTTDTSKGIFCYSTDTAPATGIYTALPTTALPNGTFNIEHLKAQDTFIILVDKKGKIISMSPAAWANLEDDENNPD